MRKIELLVIGFFLSVWGFVAMAQSPDWQVINSQYPSDEIGIATYNVITHFNAAGDGVTDDTNAFQTGLNKLGNEGGGTLFIPSGRYKISGRLTIPLGVTLRGEWKKPVKGQAIEGTILMAYYGAGQGINDYASAFITMEPTTMVMNLAIWYPEQNAGNVVSYPPSILMGKQGYWGNDYVNVRNVTLVNSYYGVCSSRNNGGGCHNVYNLYGSPLYVGLEVDNLADVGRFEWIDFSPNYWAGSGLPGSPSASDATYKDYIYHNGTGIMMRRNDWSYTCNVNIDGYSKGFSASTSMASLGGNPNGHNYNFTFINCKTAVYAEGVAGSGIMFTRFNVNNCHSGLVVADGAEGLVHLNNWTIAANGNAVLINESAATKVMMDQCTVTRGKVQALGSVFLTNNCDFNNEAPQISIGASARAIVTGNRFSGGVNIDNKSIFECVIDHTPVTAQALPSFPEVKVKTTKPAKNTLFVVTKAPYNAVADGTTDNTTAIQNALNDAGTNGGGIVFLPPGHYKVSGNLTVPTGVELRGASDIATVPKKHGSILEVYAGRGSSSGQPFLKLSANSGARGLTFNYPEQDATLMPNMPEYPYTIQVAGSNVYLVNIGLRASMHGVDMFTYKCDNHYVDYLAGHVFKTGIKVGGGSANGIICNTQFNTIAYAYGAQSKFGSWPNSPYDPSFTGAELREQCYDYNYENLEFMILGNCTDQILYNNFHFGSQRGIIYGDGNGGSPSGKCLGLGIDASRRAVCFNNIGSGGFDMINSQIVSTGPTDADTKYIQSSAGFTGKVTLFSSNYWGSATKAVTLEGGEVDFVSANFRDPGRQSFLNLTGNSQVKIQNSYIANKTFLNSGAESKVSVESSLTDYVGADTTQFALWKNNMPISPKFVADNTLDRTGWIASASLNNNNARSALDGNVSTRWATNAAQAPGQWFSVNTIVPQKFDMVILDASPSPNDGPVGYAVYISNDGVNWGNPIKSGASSAAVTVVSFPEVQAQYIKVEQTGSRSGYWSIHEFYLYCTPQEENVTILDRTGWIASAFNTNSVAQNALDGDESSRWSTTAVQVPGQWFSVDMITQQVFNRVILDSKGSPNDAPVGYRIFVSADGVNWGHPIITGASSSAITTIDIPKVRTRYIKIEQTSSKNGYWSIHEFYLAHYTPEPQVPNALDRTGWIASASVVNNNAQSAVDGISNTRWATNGPQVAGQWWSVNALKKVKFNKIILDAAQSPNDFPAAYAIYISNDGENWGDPIKTAKATKSVTEIYFDQVEAQYVKVEQTTTGVKNNYWSIHEFYLCSVDEIEYNESNTISRTGWVASAFNTNPANNAIDGNLSSRWTTVGAQTAGQWWSVNAGTPVRFNKVILDSSTSPNDAPAGYAIYISNDGVEWGDPITTGRLSASISVITFDEVEAQYVKVEQTKTGVKNNYWSIHEFYLYGTGATTTRSELAVDEATDIESTVAETANVNIFVAYSVLNVSGLSDDQPVQVNMYNLSGQKVLSSTSVETPVGYIPGGIYVVEAIQNGKVYREKVIIK